MSPRCILALALTAAAFLTGCQTGQVKAVVPIAGGGQITVPMSGTGPAPGEAEGYKVATAILQPGKESREAFYEFALVSAKAPAVSRIQIEDISDEKAAPLVDDAQPKFEAGRWTSKTEIMTPEDPRLKWVMQITSSMRVYRFTLTTTQGRQITFNHVSMYPPFFKAAVRAKWGEKY